MQLCRIFLFGFVASCLPALAQDGLPSAQDLADGTAQRFPQSVRVGDLLQRTVLEPAESRPILGKVRAVIRQPDGSLAVVMDFGGIFGLFSRPIAVPVNAMTLVGQEMNVVDYEPQQLKQFPTFNLASAKPLPSDSVIRVGLGKPSH